MRFPSSTLYSGGTGRQLGLIAAGSATSVAGQAALPALLPMVIADLGITPRQAGIMLTVLAVASAASRYPGGRLSDGLSRKTVVTTAFLTWIVGFTVVAVAHSYALLVLGAAIVGLGAGLYIPASVALVTDLFIERRGTALSINNASVNLGGVAAAVLAGVATFLAGWRVTFIPIVLILMCVVILFHYQNDDPYVVSTVDLAVRDTLVRIFTLPSVRIALIGFFLFTFVWQGVLSFLPTFLQTRGFTPAISRIAFATLFGAGAIANPAMGRLSDHIGYIRVALLAAGLGLAGLSGLLIARGTAGMLVAVVLFASGLATIFPIMSGFIMDHVPTTNRGGDYGAVTAIYIGLGGLGPAYVGAVAQRFSYTDAFLGFIGCLLIGVIVLLRLPHGRTATASSE